MNKFDKLKLGDKAEITHTITQKDIDLFVELTGDDNKLHVDEKYASKTSFKKPVAHGMLGASFISTIIGTKLPGDGALWFSQNMDFLLPVRVGDKITVKAQIIKKIETLKVVEIKTDIINQNKQKVTTGIAKVRIVEPEVRQDLSQDHKSKKKTALVIGGTGGIGRAVCLQLARDGFDIAVHYCSNKERARQVKKEIEKIGRLADSIGADITDAVQVEDLIEKVIRKFGAVTVLVNCATVKIPSIRFMSLDWQDIQKHLDINIKGSFNLIKSILPHMERENYGKIINITTQAVEVPNSDWTHYITAKAALNGFSKAIAVELSAKGIMVNMVSPGMTDTELIADIPEKIRLLTASKTPLGRLAKPQDIADAISFLASSRADFLTGETIRVNGGQVML